MSKGKNFAVFALLLLLVIVIMEKLTKLGQPTKPVKRRKGDGDFGAYRKAHPTKPHQGQDYLAAPGQDVFAPLDGTVRIGEPYPGDSRYKLVEIKGGAYGVKLMYVLPIVKTGQKVSRGQKIGTVQNLILKYGASFLAQNHIHIEVRRAGLLVNPDRYFPDDTIQLV